jgi:ATP-binding cassette subfamily C protein/ATP-binding cassette subfamily C exporter for protease/lipase/ATP-binding cassette subfamily C protein EexD
MSKTTGNRRDDPTELQLALRACGPAFMVVAGFSLAMNLLMLAPAIYMLQVYDRVLTTGSLETLLMLTLIIGVILLVISLMEVCRTNITIRTGVWLNDRVGPALIERGVRARIDGNATDAQPMRDLTQLQSFIATSGLSFLFDAPWLPVYVLLIWLLHPLLGMVALVGALLMLLLTVINNLLTRKATLTANNQQIAATQQVDAAFRNAEAVRAMGMLPAVIGLWRQKNDKGMTSLISGAETGSTIQSSTRFVRLFLQSGILGLGAMLVIRGEMSGGAMIAASILLGRAMGPVELAVTAWRNFLVTRAAYQRMQLLLSGTPRERVRTRLPEPRGHLTVENLTFVPPDLGHPVLRRVSFSLDPGTALAIIGPSAAGKSTLGRFLVGLGKPTSGSVRLDGFELDDWDREQLGRAVGYLPQSVELFCGSVRANISRMEVSAEDERVTEAAHLAHAHNMIATLSNGYDCEIGDGGVRLSAGQRQRIGLARAVFGNPRLIVLDEPNANLDTSGESALAAALAVLKARGSTLVIIGHRPSTLAQADKLMLLRDGVVELLGPREEVLQKLRNAAQAKNSVAATQSGVEPHPPIQDLR